jgi:hypothetical protein
MSGFDHHDVRQVEVEMPLVVEPLEVVEQLGAMV